MHNCDLTGYFTPMRNRQFIKFGLRGHKFFLWNGLQTQSMMLQRLLDIPSKEYTDIILPGKYKEPSLSLVYQAHPFYIQPISKWLLCGNKISIVEIIKIFVSITTLKSMRCANNWIHSAMKVIFVCLCNIWGCVFPAYTFLFWQLRE